MWPELLDMTREESKRILRRVELEAYSSVISAFRAQGDLSKDKKKMLHDLQNTLSISTERHRAEVRRAVNDEKLATIAENMSPANSTQDWLVEGRRLVPLMPRLVPQTAFTVTANQAANLQAEKNASLPSPSQTGIRDVTLVTTPPPSNRPSRPDSPTSNVVVLPSGMSIHIKGGLNMEDEEDVQVRKRRRSTSTDGMTSPTGPPIPQVTYTTTMASLPTMSPKKITISKSPQAAPRVVASGSQTQKVILVSNTGQVASQSIIPQKSIAMPVARTTISTGTSTTIQTKPLVFPSSSVATNTTIANIVTMAGPALMTSASTTTTVMSPLPTAGTSTMAFLTPTISVSRPRFKTVPRQKILQLPSPRPGGVVIPMGPQPVQPSPHSAMKSLGKTGIQIRQEGGMKIITQNVAGTTSKIITQAMPGTTSKILPKPSQLSAMPGTPVVVVSAGSSGTLTSSMAVNRPITTLTAGSQGAKVLNIQTQGGKIVSAGRGTSVVTMNPKTLHLVKNAPGLTTPKANVIVVQKTQQRRVGTIAAPQAMNKATTAVISSPFEKELVSFLQKQDPTKQYVVTTSTANLSKPMESTKKVIVNAPPGTDLKQLTQTLQRSKPDSETSKATSTLLQDLIKAAGIGPDSNPDRPPGEVTLNLDETQLAALNVPQQNTTQPKVSQQLPSNEWFEYDVTDDQGNTFTHTAESADTAAAIQSLLDMQQAAAASAHKPRVTVQKSASIDIGQLSDQLNQQQQQFYTIDEALTIVNQADKDPTAAATTYVTDDTGVQAPVLEAGEVGMLDDPGETYTAIPLHQSGVSISIAPEMRVPAVATQTKPGDLDPQTGMFRGNKHTQPTVVHAGVVGTGKRISETQEVIVVGHGQQTHGRTVEVLTSSADLLSSSIAQAHLDLDPYEFIENGQNYRTAGNVVTEMVVSREPQGDLNMNVAMETAVSTQDSGSTQSGIVGVVPETIPQPAVLDPHLASNNVILQKVVSQPITTTTPSIRIQAGSGAFVPLRDSVAKSTIKPSTINIMTQKQAVPSVQVVPTSGSSLHVMVEPSGIDTSHMKLEDFSSQQLTDRGEYAGIDHMEEISSLDSPSAGSSGLSDSQGEGSQYFDSQSPYVVGKRKRKSQSGDEAPVISPGVGTGWVRAALGVLNKVSRYRGANRDKNDLNAATWFTQPVDPADAPDYYTIVETPMDFGSIRRRLEGGKYGEYDEFHGDMMLVHDNCHLYNPDQSVVRRDCDEVFVYFQQEHDRLLEKWQKTHIASPLSKKARASDKSPVRS